MTDGEYLRAKKQLCSTFSCCSISCPLYAYMEAKGVHACGPLCEILEQEDLEKAKELLASLR